LATPARRRGARRVFFFLSCLTFLAIHGGRVRVQPASREEIVEAATKQVKVLEETAAVLETYRAVRGAGAGAAPRPEVAVAVGTVCFCARLPAPRPGSLTRVLEAFHRRGVEVLVATVVRHGHGGAAVVTVTAAAGGAGADQGGHRRHQLMITGSFFLASLATPSPCCLQLATSSNGLLVLFLEHKIRAS